ncbi:hydroxymethylglutaryl-CoA lyase [Stenotrophomonas oahuensis]|uniref:Hydroxymethylglutaryl-CoA lyase n=1 Tax=Stenotrophomonas oahuensis TaxID=3003271 RepID=A0ABY9YPT7_9GAMM|nr:hydroxymethylglutaryl-CoA lyase [Stenotrophomonas sp. A5586]WNH52223.1 hydroxymethylglutaryl-CoA lyase [Stenotrophomonas sp. A5586]
MTASRPLVVQEVCLRDGLQIEPVFVPTAEKIRLGNAFGELGFARVEVSSFVSPRAVPALVDAAEVFAGLKRAAGTVYVALVPNLKGAERALAAGADELNLVMSAGETHNLANMRMTAEQSFAGFAQIATLNNGSKLLNGTVATAFGCPFEGVQAPAKVLDIVRRYLDLGCTGITLADTTGMANPRQVARLVEQALQLVDAAALTLHFHDTRGLGLANVVAAYDAGAQRFDASLGGLGGCPFAPGASGNICTEDLVAMCEEMVIPTGLDLLRLIELSKTLPALVGHETSGQVAKAGRVGDLHPAPPGLRAA